MSDIKYLTELADTFRAERDWKQFHNLKDMAISLSLECSELLELFQWKDNDELLNETGDIKRALEDELSDVLYWVLLLSKDLDIDVVEAFKKKLELNRKKYPADRARGSKKKYSEL